MKIRLEKSYRVYEVYGDIEFDPQDYPEMEGMSDEEIIAYLNENMYEFNLNQSDEVLKDQFTFETDILKEKHFDEDEEIILVKE